MKTICINPDCAQPRALFDRQCPHCGTPSTLRALFACTGERLARAHRVRCPACTAPVAFLARVCPFCRQPLHATAILAMALHWFRAPKEEAVKRRVRRFWRWTFFLGSASGLWTLLSLLQPYRWEPLFIGSFLLSVVFLAFQSLLVLWTVPRRFVRASLVGISALAKLGWVCNFLSLLLVQQILIVRFWGQALILVALFVGVFIACFFFLQWLLPHAVAAAWNFAGPEPSAQHDPFSPHGRRAEHD
jgi:hypothetical protein